jgi:hypothetical protein
VQTQTNDSHQKGFLKINQLKNEYKIKMIRSGEKIQIQNTEVAADDTQSLKKGDRVTADGSYVREHSRKINNMQEIPELTAVSVNESFSFVLNSGAVESGDRHVLVIVIGLNSQS